MKTHAVTPTLCLRIAHGIIRCIGCSHIITIHVILFIRLTALIKLSLAAPSGQARQELQ